MRRFAEERGLFCLVNRFNIRENLIPVKKASAWRPHPVKMKGAEDEAVTASTLPMPCRGFEREKTALLARRTRRRSWGPLLEKLIAAIGKPHLEVLI